MDNTFTGINRFDGDENYFSNNIYVSRGAITFIGDELGSKIYIQPYGNTNYFNIGAGGLQLSGGDDGVRIVTTKPLCTTEYGYGTSNPVYPVYDGNLLRINGTINSASTGVPNVTQNPTYASARKTIYAPTTAGTSGYVLTSNGTGAPTWKNPSVIINTYQRNEIQYFMRVVNNSAKIFINFMLLYSDDTLVDTKTELSQILRTAVGTTAIVPVSGFYSSATNRVMGISYGSATTVQLYYYTPSSTSLAIASVSITTDHLSYEKIPIYGYGEVAE